MPDTHGAGTTGARPLSWSAQAGQTATEFTGHLGHAVEEGADAAVRMATLGADTPTGTVTDRDGVLPW